MTEVHVAGTNPRLDPQSADPAAAPAVTPALDEVNASPGSGRLRMLTEASRAQSSVKNRPSRSPTAKASLGGYAIAYFRVSSHRQTGTALDLHSDGNSIASQREQVQRKAEMLGVRIGREFVEPGISAQTIEKRPVFRELLRYVKEHAADIDYLIVFMRSRAFRNYVDAGVTERQLEQLGVQIVSANEDFGEGLWADAMKGVADIMNEVQVRITGEDTRIKMEHKARSGGTISRSKLGYLNVRTSIDGRLVNTIAVDEVRAPFVRQAFERYSLGDISIHALNEQLRDAGLVTRITAQYTSGGLSDVQLGTILRDPYYAGFIVYRGERIPGRHQPIVPLDLFDDVQLVLDRRRQSGAQNRTPPHYLKGLLYCAKCHSGGNNRQIKVMPAKAKTGLRCSYFDCVGRPNHGCNLGIVPVPRVEEYIEQIYQRLNLPAALISRLEELCQSAEYAAGEAKPDARSAELQAQWMSISDQEERLLDLTVDGTMPMARIRARLEGLSAQRASIEDELKLNPLDLASGFKLVRLSLALSKNPIDLYRRAPDDIRQLLNQTYFERLYIGEAGRVTEAVLRPPFRELMDVARHYAGEDAGAENSPVAAIGAGLVTDLAVANAGREKDLERCEWAVNQIPRSWPPVVRDRLLPRARIKYRLDEAAIAAIVAAYGEGTSGEALAVTYGISPSTVYKLVRRRGGVVRPKHEALSARRRSAR